jgi:hypothetical protein
MTFTIELDKQELKQLEHSAQIRIYSVNNRICHDPVDMIVISIYQQVIKQLPKPTEP